MAVFTNIVIFLTINPLCSTLILWRRFMSRVLPGTLPGHSISPVEGTPVWKYGWIYRFPPTPCLGRTCGKRSAAVVVVSSREVEAVNGKADFLPKLCAISTRWTKKCTFITDYSPCLKKFYPNFENHLNLWRDWQSYIKISYRGPVRCDESRTCPSDDCRHLPIGKVRGIKYMNVRKLPISKFYV